MDSNGNENETQVGSTTTCGSERKDPRWEYARLPYEQDDLVFDDAYLTWGDVARASEAKEPRFDTRARASSSMLPSSRGNDTTSSSRPMPSHYVDVEDE